MSKYEKMDLNKLKKELTKLKKQAVKRPIRSEFDEKKNKLQREIDEMTIKAAESKYEQEQAIKKAEEVREAHTYIQARFRDASAQLKTQSDSRNKANKGLRELLKNEGRGGKNLRLTGDPKLMKDELDSEIKQIQASLQLDSHNAGSEKKLIRRLRLLNEQMIAVQKRIDSGMVDRLEDREQKTKDYRASKETHDEIYQEKLASTKKMDDTWRIVTDIREQSTKLQTSMKEKKKAKMQIDRDFNEKERSYKNWQNSVNEVESLINRRKLEETSSPAPKKEEKASKKKDKSPKKGGDAKADDKKKGDDKSKSPKKEPKKGEKVEKTPEELEKEKREEIEKRKKRALAEYNRMKAEVEKSTKEFESRKTKEKSPTKSASPVTSQAEVKDPNEEAKAICQSLIVALNTMKPVERAGSSSGKKRKKKKKGNRLKFNPIVFGNFERVGVAIPKSTKEIDKSIEALQERMASYDKEDTKETEPKIDTTEEESKV
eukprot:UN29038